MLTVDLGIAMMDANRQQDENKMTKRKIKIAVEKVETKRKSKLHYGRPIHPKIPLKRGDLQGILEQAWANTVQMQEDQNEI